MAMLSGKYRVNEVRTTSPHPHMAYWQRLDKRIQISYGVIIGFKTGLKRDKLTAKAVEYFISGVFVRKVLKGGTYSAHAYWVPLLDLDEADLRVFSEELRKRPEWVTYQHIRELSLCSN